MPDGKVFFVRPDDIVHDTIEGETVVIDLRSGVYFRFEGAATHAWEALVERTTEADLIDRIAAAYAAPRETIEAAVHDFLLALYRDGVIRREDALAAASHEATAPDWATAPDRATVAQGVTVPDRAAAPGAAAAWPEPTTPEAPAETQGAPFTGMPLERFGQLRPLLGESDRLPFDGMAVSRFEDLDELLTIDPVHEVRDEGWPHRQAAG